ncbi:MAG: EAL domain-containing protein [Leptospirales bacterium]|nr:EAL domain-containing protein [Leptospirales bacterium]
MAIDPANLDASIFADDSLFGSDSLASTANVLVQFGDIERFKREFIESNRGKPLFIVRFENVGGVTMQDFVDLINQRLGPILDQGVDHHYYFDSMRSALILGIAPLQSVDAGRAPNIDNAIGKLHEEVHRKRLCTFGFGVARTQCNFISNSNEILDVLLRSSAKNLRDNLIRWSWTYFNRANTYFAGNAEEAVIQPTVYYDHRARRFTVKGGEVFVGGGLYKGYHELISDIPEDEDLERIELLILEKLIIACEKTPGVLKFNISPQTILDTFSQSERVVRLNRLLHARGLNPRNVRFELVEKPYEETGKKLKEVCQEFHNFGITFAADDFGVKSQSHQVILDLGQMIKEFKLDPISFKFKPDEDRTKFLDNLAFISYCKRLADNREALITAEAVEDVDTLKFLLELHIHQYQANMFCSKMPVTEYRLRFAEMRDLPEDTVIQILSDADLADRQRETGDIFQVAREAGLLPAEGAGSADS